MIQKTNKKRANALVSGLGIVFILAILFIIVLLALRMNTFAGEDYTSQLTQYNINTHSLMQDMLIANEHEIAKKITQGNKAGVEEKIIEMDLLFNDYFENPSCVSLIDNWNVLTKESCGISYIPGTTIEVSFGINVLYNEYILGDIPDYTDIRLLIVY